MQACLKEPNIHKSKSPQSRITHQSVKFSSFSIIDEFHGRRWMPLEPKLLNYDNTQFLIIGHGDEALEKAAKPQDGEDQRPDKETPLEAIEKLEHEDEIRVEHLKGLTIHRSTLYTLQSLTAFRRRCCVY